MGFNVQVQGQWLSRTLSQPPTCASNLLRHHMDDKTQDQGTEDDFRQEIAIKCLATGRPHLGAGDLEDPGNFFRSAKWCARAILFIFLYLLTRVLFADIIRCPDGTRALAQCENRSLQLLQLCVEHNVTCAVDNIHLPGHPNCWKRRWHISVRVFLPSHRGEDIV